MSPENQRIAIAEFCGIEEPNECPSCHLYKGQGHTSFCTFIPDYLNDLNAIHEAEKIAGLHDPIVSLRVRWVNHLRSIVGRTAPKNKVGAPIVSDVDLILCDIHQRREALLRAIGKWEEAA